MTPQSARSKALEKAREIFPSIVGWELNQTNLDWLHRDIAKALDTQRQEVLSEILEELDDYRRAYSTTLFPEPPSGEHGKTIDSCSARMGRSLVESLDKRTPKEGGGMIIDTSYLKELCKREFETYHKSKPGQKVCGYSNTEETAKLNGKYIYLPVTGVYAILTEDSHEFIF